MIKRGLTLVNAMQCTVLPHITASVFINDDERGLYADYEKWYVIEPDNIFRKW